jgi:hypothetical protein
MNVGESQANVFFNVFNMLFFIVNATRSSDLSTIMLDLQTEKHVSAMFGEFTRNVI